MHILWTAVPELCIYFLKTEQHGDRLLKLLTSIQKAALFIERAAFC